MLGFLRHEDGAVRVGAAASLRSWDDADRVLLDCLRATLTVFSQVAGVESRFDLLRLTANTNCSDAGADG